MPQYLCSLLSLYSNFDVLACILMTLKKQNKLNAQDMS
jgi:hypothetical protein